MKGIFSIVCLAVSLAASSMAFAQDASLMRLLQSAYDQVGKTVSYDPSYEAIGFPGGDVPISRGVCTDVIARAYRGIGIDLQFLVNQDMRSAFCRRSAPLAGSPIPPTARSRSRRACVTPPNRT